MEPGRVLAGEEREALAQPAARMTGTARVAVRTGERDGTGEPVVELRTRAADPADPADPAALVRSAARPKTIGPGRIERRYLERIAGLERGQEASLAQERHLTGELDAARLLERGSQRLLDKMEDRLEKGQAVERRLILALGAMQQENARLGRKVARLEALPPPPSRNRRAGPALPGLLRAWFGRRGDR